MSDVVEVYENESGEWRWRRIAGNGEIISTGEPYTTRANAYTGALRANALGRGAGYRLFFTPYTEPVKAAPKKRAHKPKPENPTTLV